MSTPPVEYVVRTATDGWRVAGTRVSLDSVVHAYWDGKLPEAIAADFPALSLEQVHGAIAFYLRHRAVVDRHLAEQDARWDQLRQESVARHGPLVQRVRAAGQPVAPGDGP